MTPSLLEAATNDMEILNMSTLFDGSGDLPHTGCVIDPAMMVCLLVIHGYPHLDHCPAGMESRIPPWSKVFVFVFVDHVQPRLLNFPSPS